jgi:uncharacterized membrane protein YphA (DoxX/SURF4 family)
MAQLRPTQQSTPQQPQAPIPQLTRAPAVATVRMFTGWTIVFLVVLRILIGWHFFIEGAWKLCQPDWRATGYLVASAGPMRETFRKMVKDVDGRKALAIDQPAILKGSELTGIKAQELHDLLAKELNQRLDEMFASVVQHYGLDANQQNLAANTVAAQRLKLSQVCDDKDFIAQVWDYKVSLDEIEEQEAKINNHVDSTTFERQRLQEMYKRKSATKSDLIGKADKIILDLPAQIYKAKGPAASDGKVPWLLNDTQLAKGFMKTAFSQTRFIDISNMIGLTVVGVCLILGLFTRLACLGAAGLLMMYYCSMPPLPGLLEGGPVEGHYLVINKNLIELVTVLMLATTRIGRWGGLDGLIAAKAKPAV